MDYLRDTLRRNGQGGKQNDPYNQSPKYVNLKNVIEDSLKDLAVKSPTDGKKIEGTGRIIVFTHATEENLEVQSNQWRKDLTATIEKINASAKAVRYCLFSKI